MLSKSEAEEILLDLSTLPPEKGTEVRDFIFFLKGRYGHEKVRGRE